MAPRPLKKQKQKASADDDIVSNSSKSSHSSLKSIASTAAAAVKKVGRTVKSKITGSSLTASKSQASSTAAGKDIYPDIQLLSQWVYHSRHHYCGL